MKANYIFLIQFLFGQVIFAQSHEKSMEDMIDSFYQSHPKATGIMVDVESISKNISWTYAVGYSDKNLKTILSPDQPA